MEYPALKLRKCGQGLLEWIAGRKGRIKIFASLLCYCLVMAMCLYFMLSGKILVLFEQVQRLNELGWLLFIAFILVVSIPTIPGYIPVCLSGGFIWGWYAMLIIVPTVNVCANAVYWMFRTQCALKKMVPKSATAYVDEFILITKNHPFICITAVRISAVPYNVVNVWCAMAHVPWYKYAGISFVTMLFDQVTSVSVGSGLKDLSAALSSTSSNSTSLALTITQIVVTVLISIGAGVLSSRVYKKLKRKQLESVSNMDGDTLETEGDMASGAASPECIPLDPPNLVNLSTLTNNTAAVDVCSPEVASSLPEHIKRRSPKREEVNQMVDHNTFHSLADSKSDSKEEFSARPATPNSPKSFATAECVSVQLPDRVDGQSPLLPPSQVNLPFHAGLQRSLEVSLRLDGKPPSERTSPDAGQ